MSIQNLFPSSIERLAIILHMKLQRIICNDHACVLIGHFPHPARKAPPLKTLGKTLQKSGNGWKRKGEYPNNFLVGMCYSPVCMRKPKRDPCIRLLKGRKNVPPVKNGNEGTNPEGKIRIFPLFPLKLLK